MAGSGYFRTACTHCKDNRERVNQFKLVRHILTLKGFSKRQIGKIQNLSSKPKVRSKEMKKKFVTIIKFNECSNRHRFVKSFFKKTKIDLDKYYVPMQITFMVLHISSGVPTMWTDTSSLNLRYRLIFFISLFRDRFLNI